MFINSYIQEALITIDIKINTLKTTIYNSKINFSVDKLLTKKGRYFHFLQ
jgi:hypothetical protein